jgi:hypothetical protein
VLAGWLGPIGAPIGSIMGVCLVTLPLTMGALSREVGVSVEALLVPLWPWFWRFLLLSQAAIVVGLYFGSLQFVGLAITSTSAALVYVAVMFRPAADSALGGYLRPRLMPIWGMLTSARSAVQRRSLNTQG